MNRLHLKVKRFYCFFPFFQSVACIYVTIPPRPPEYVNFLTISILAGDHLVVPIGASYISSWLQKYNQGSGRKRTKNKQTIGAWVSSKCKKRSYVTLHSLCICRLSLTCSCCEILTSHEECRLILTGLPSLILDSISCRLVSAAVRCQLPTARLCLPSPTAFSGFLLPTPHSRSLTHFQSRRRLRAQAFV